MTREWLNLNLRDKILSIGDHIVLTNIFSILTEEMNSRVSQVTLVVKNPPALAGDIMRCWLYSYVGKIICRRAWQPTPLFLPGESRGQTSPVGYSL